MVIGKNTVLPRNVKILEMLENQLEIKEEKSRINFKATDFFINGSTSFIN
ncbi:hypothetical protein ACER0A_010675 [Haloimpatiens sp. FM7315]